MPQLRPMNEDERAFLQQELETHRRNWRHGFVILALITLGGGFFLAFPIRLVLTGLSLLPDFFGWQSMLQNAQSLPNTFAISFTFMLIFATFGLPKHIWQSQKHKKSIKQDLHDGNIMEQTLTVHEVKVFREPEHGGRILFLLTENRRVFTLYDYESPTTSNSKHWLKPKKFLTLLTYPHSKTLDMRWSGDLIKTPRATTITLPPEQWPEAEEWCEIEWENLKSTLTA